MVWLVHPTMYLFLHYKECHHISNYVKNLLTKYNNKCYHVP
jgi:hypothetical protein